MPIRMVEDDPQSNKKQSRRPVRRSSTGTGMSGGMGNLIGAVLPYLFKRPKLLIVLIVAGLAFYFFFGKSCSTSSLLQEGGLSNFMTGGLFNKEIYEETEIFEPLADNKKNPLPERVSLQEYCPTPLNQGKQGSCVAWASAYAARTIIEAIRTGEDPDKLRYSPAFMYNQISIDHNTCQGSYIKYAMDNLYNIGAVPFSSFKYDDTDCNRQPDSGLKAKANTNKIKGFQRLTEEGKGKAYEVLAMKQNLAKKSPVIIGMMVGGTFMQNMIGKEMWTPSNADYYQQGFGGHAMCVVGYDDYKEGGSFLIMNSWGTEWGKSGFAWVRYSDFKEFNIEAYGLYPMGDASKKVQQEFEGEFALELNDGKKTIPLRQVNGNYFETNEKVAKNDKFKVEFTNNIECYTYIFGEEVDGSSYVLFPYTPKHSPYCGITGTRLFPRDYSMVVDDKGTTDKIAIVITRNPIDYEVFNKKINQLQGANYQAKVAAACGASNRVSYSGQQSIHFKAAANSNEMVYFVIGVKK